jgi:hypothetical protein
MAVLSRARRAGLAGALALTALGSSVPAASAGENESIKTKGGLVTFEHRDEVVTAKDTRRDGLGVQAVLAWSDATGRNRTVFVIDGGADTLSQFKDLSIREGTKVALTMCYVGEQGPVKCSHAQRARA